MGLQDMNDVTPGDIQYLVLTQCKTTAKKRCLSGSLLLLINNNADCAFSFYV